MRVLYASKVFKRRWADSVAVRISDHTTLQSLIIINALEYKVNLSLKFKYLCIAMYSLVMSLLT